MGGTIPIGEFCRQVGVFLASGGERSICPITKGCQQLLGEVLLQHMESSAKGIKCTSVMDENLRTA